MQMLADPFLLADKIAAFGLPGVTLDDGLAVDDQAWPVALGEFRNRRITGFAVAAMEEGVLELSEQQVNELLEAHRQEMLQPLLVERGLLELAPILDRAGVDFIVLKGSALAHTVYPDPSWRYFGDLDLLVRAADWQRACSMLQDLGFRRNHPEPRPGFVERFGGAPAFRRETGVEVDLHRTLVVGPFGLWADTDQLFGGTQEFRMGQRTFRRLDDTSLLLHACIHASLGSRPPLTVPVRDVAQVAHHAEVDWEALVERAARWHLASVVRHALQHASQALGTPIPTDAETIMSESGGRKERRALRAYVTDRQSFGGASLSTLSAIKGFRPKAAYVRGLIFPDRTFLSDRQGGRVSYVARWRIPIRWLRSRVRLAWRQRA
jgi:Uncharacterised nucleotidyltransferase